MNVKYFFYPLLCLLFSSCEEVIEIDLNEGDSKIVIEGGLTDQANGCKIKISKSISFDKPNEFPTVDNASVTITDQDGNIYSLESSESGVYSNTELVGQYNKKYFLKATIEGKTYEAFSTMPDSVLLDSIQINEIAFFGNSTKLVDLFLQDPIDQENYYKFIPYVNGKKFDNLEILDDQFTNGLPVDYSIFFQDYELVLGDSVGIEVWNIDKGVYNYFNSLADIIDGGGQTAAPANPNTNLSNGALGYFSAHAISSRGILVE